MITPLTSLHNSRLRVRCMIDSYEEFQTLRNFFDDDELGEIKGEPDTDGKYRFVIDVVRISGAEPKGTK